MIEHVGFGVNGFSMRDPFDPLIDSVGLEAAVQAYERRWGPSSDGGRAQVGYIIRAYLSASASLIVADQNDMRVERVECVSYETGFEQPADPI